MPSLGAGRSRYILRVLPWILSSKYVVARLENRLVSPGIIPPKTEGSQRYCSVGWKLLHSSAIFKVCNALKVTINNFPGIQLEKFCISLEKIF